MRELEDASEYFGVSKTMLMENAGRAAAQEIKQYIKRTKNFEGSMDHKTKQSKNPIILSIPPTSSSKRLSKGIYPLVVCYHGNNGGDGFVIARLLGCKVYFFGKIDKLKPEALQAYTKLSKNQFASENDIDDADLIIDCIFGTGIKGEVKGISKKVIDHINSSNALKISIDVPSGIDPDYGKTQSVHIKADKIITFHDMKPGLRNMRKKTTTVEIGIPPQTKKVVGHDYIKKNFPMRKSNSHKGKNGRLLIIGGSKDYIGAPALAGLAALRSGCDLVTIAAPENTAYAINAISPDLITYKLNGDYLKDSHIDEILELVTKNDCVLIGPGLGKGDVSNLLKLIKKKAVVDADAIKQLKSMKNRIITPHIREFKQWAGFEFKDSKQIQKLAGTGIILFKGSIDRIVTKNGIKYNISGNSGMTVGGTGDLLAGITAGLLAQTDALEYSAAAAAYILGKSADRAYKKMRYYYIASDLLDELPPVMKDFL